MATSPCCPREADAYRQCLYEKRSSGRKCDGPMRILEECRAKWRKANDVGELKFDGTRILPPQHCMSLNAEVQACFKRTGVDEKQCRPQIDALKECMTTAPGRVAPPPK